MVGTFRTTSDRRTMVVIYFHHDQYQLNPREYGRIDKSIPLLKESAVISSIQVSSYITHKIIVQIGTKCAIARELWCCPILSTLCSIVTFRKICTNQNLVLPVFVAEGVDPSATLYARCTLFRRPILIVLPHILVLLNETGSLLPCLLRIINLLLPLLLH